METSSATNQRATGLLLVISLIVAIAFPVYNLAFLYPSFDELLKNNTEDEALRVANYLSSMLPVTLGKINKNDISEGFIKNLQTMQVEFKIIELKIYAPDGEVLYSSDAEDIGDVNKNTYFQQIVAKGQKYTKVVPKETKSLENKIIKLDVVETYIPVMKDNRFVGAFEIYYDITQKKALLSSLVSRSSIMVIILSIIFMAMSLYSGPHCQDHFLVDLRYSPLRGYLVC
ncbi:hypothetical protein [Candidatus Magnetomonas plexicatena]|uniref:hypothetical protein n=1 Tax=Candidatus Magnetomonas plexicatena TaxID=2552947 RepID=UPI001101CAA2|nr:hypothetical protein E2O03_005060 [Nitrospirales bacterium LBB_01]QWR76938.1 hypothetical protein E2O03_005205 [Nitrospirales bacterium LBB_01]